LLNELRKQDISYLCLIYEKEDAQRKNKKEENKKRNTSTDDWNELYWTKMLISYFENVLEKTDCPFSNEEILKHYVN